MDGSADGLGGELGKRLGSNLGGCGLGNGGCWGFRSSRSGNLSGKLSGGTDLELLLEVSGFKVEVVDFALFKVVEFTGFLERGLEFTLDNSNLGISSSHGEGQNTAALASDHGGQNKAGGDTHVDLK